MGMSIRVTDGPYIVSGGVPLREMRIVRRDGIYVWEHVRDIPADGTYALCRCGRSRGHPFCDGSHRFFRGRETADRRPYAERADTLRGPGLTVRDDGRCAKAMFCHRHGRSLWAMLPDTGDPAVRDEAIRAASECPAGRTVALDMDGDPIEDTHEPGIWVVQGPSRGSGGLYVMGGIPLEGADGSQYEIRERYVLCRCGRSGDRPFCDASHVASMFDDSRRVPSGGVRDASRRVRAVGGNGYYTLTLGEAEESEMQNDYLGYHAEQYLASLRAKGRKENTVACYRNNLRQCFMYLQADGRPIEPDLITADDVQYLWRSIDVKEEVRQGYVRALARYVIYHTGRDVVKQADILRNREVRDRVFIGKDEYAILLEHANPFQRIILVLGGMMGLRRAEMIGIRDADVKESSIVIHGKGHGPEGMVTVAYMPPDVRSEIDAYRSWKRARMDDSGDGYLIQTRSRRGEWSRATPQQVSTAVHRLGQDCGIEVTTHSLRRLFATTLFYDANTDIQTVRSLMRHANVNTTLKCYIDANDTRERTAVKEVSKLLYDGDGRRGERKRKRCRRCRASTASDAIRPGPGTVPVVVALKQSYRKCSFAPFWLSEGNGN